MEAYVKKISRPRALKIYRVTDTNGKSVYVKAKTKTNALNYIVSEYFKVSQVSPKEMVEVMNAISDGAEVIDAE